MDTEPQQKDDLDNYQHEIQTDSQENFSENLMEKNWPQRRVLMYSTVS